MDNKKEKYILTPVFQTKEQEELFSKCANEVLFNENSDTLDVINYKEYKNVLTPVFQTKEQEELFSKCAKESMHEYIKENKEKVRRR